MKFSKQTDIEPKGFQVINFDEFVTADDTVESVQDHCWNI